MSHLTTFIFLFFFGVIFFGVFFVPFWNLTEITLSENHILLFSVEQPQHHEGE